MNEANAPRELTFKAVVLGIILSVVLSAANAYLGLFAGMTVSASIPAAVISMGLLAVLSRSGLIGGHTIQENNIVQTAASAGESLAAGVIFTFPALIILGAWESFDYFQTMLIAMLGGTLGVMFTIPLRRALITPGELTFPEGVATAEVLRTGDKGDSSGLALIAISGLVGGVMKFFGSALKAWPEAAEVAFKTGTGGGFLGYIGTNLSPALVSVGYIVRLNIAVLVFSGGAIAWFIAIPIYYAMYGEQYADIDAAAEIAWTIWDTKIRYLGVGAMIVGGFWALISVRKALVEGIRSSLEAGRQVKSGGGLSALKRTERDTPINWVFGGIVVSVIPITVVYFMATGKWVVALPMAILMVITGFLFSAVAAYMAGLVGSSNNPISGVTIATVLFASLLLLVLLGSGAGKDGAAAAILVAAVVCCAAALSGDTMQDLKAGYLVGATPWKQQVMELVGVVSAALVIPLVLNILHKGKGFQGQPNPIEGVEPLAAPQATLMASVADGIFGGGLPWGMIVGGGVIAVAIILFDLWLESRGSDFRAPVLAVAVGIYLPFELSVPILIGGVIAWAADKMSGKNKDSAHRGLLIASGLITGEALVGIMLAVPLMKNPKFWGETVPSLDLGSFGPFLGLAVLAMVCYGLFRGASTKPSS